MTMNLINCDWPYLRMCTVAHGKPSACLRYQVFIKLPSSSSCPTSLYLGYTSPVFFHSQLLGGRLRVSGGYFHRA